MALGRVGTWGVTARMQVRNCQGFVGGESAQLVVRSICVSKGFSDTMGQGDDEALTDKRDRS
jgi:hypothetical protein